MLKPVQSLEWRKKEFSTCINPEFGIASDVCGCCAGSCPSACTCSCVTTSGDEGLRIIIDKGDVIEKGDEASDERCIPESNANALVALDGYSCITTCNEQN